MKRIIAAAVTIGILSASASAQGPRKPATELKDLANLVGTWHIEGEEEGARYTMNETCDWFTGGFHIVCRSEGTGVMGAMKAQAIIGYDAEEKTFTRYGHNSLGIGTLMRGTISGRIWTWTGEVRAGGGLLKVRTTVTEQSPSSYLFKTEGSFGGGPWNVLEEGKGTKAP